ncbi:hypothetical protein EMCRGX_G027184 [Ephydatia muelleri]
MENWSVTALCIQIGLLSLLCDAQSPTFTQATDVAVSSSGQVFVGDSVDGLLYRLGSSLVQQESVALPSGGSILRLALTSDESKLVACLNNGNCIAYDAKNLAKGPLRVFQGVLSSSDSVALVSAPVSGGGNSFYVGSSNGTVNLIGQYGLDGTAGSVSRTSGNLFSVTLAPGSTFTRRWFGGFVAGSYTYFVVLDVSTSAISRPGVRVLRVCDNSNETTVAAMYEAEINCFSLNAVDTSSVLLGASLLESFSSGGASTLVIGFSTPNFPPYSRVCTVGLPSIDSSMNSAYCSPTSLPWRAATTSSLSCPNRCTISSPGAIGVPISDTPNAAYLSTSIISTYTYTSTLAFNYESLALLFIAYTDNNRAFIQEYNITTTPPAVSSIATWPMPGPVTRLTWTSGQNYVYAITSTSVVQVPIEQCSSFTDCLSCAANVNPLCGWCTVEQKCSRRSQCQNSTVSARWVQGNTSQCLSNTIVTPTTFTLERPTNITLTISSGLPSPLTRESFLCLLSTGNGVPISVPCSRVNQTTFIYNITGAISQLNTPKLVVNIGFGSSLLNIPFATSRLTTYNCAAATSCSSCLQTDGVCGWCNVEKRCTAVNSSCSNFTSVTPAGGQTYLDVSVDICTPVNVRQPNGPDITLPANYTNSTSISCLYTAAQISLPVGTSTMLANISLIWTNSGTVVYPIDPLGVIQVTLYSCSGFSFTSCTSCLAVNIEICPSITNQLLNCPPPVLKSVSPPSGPFGGGTRLTITGTDLGVTVGDIANVSVGGLNCSVQPDGFKPGAQFVCVTGNYPYGGMPQTVPISVTIKRSGSVATAQSTLTYTYVRPSISSVFPKSGPMAGRTSVTIEGMSLNVGNGVKRVLLNGAMCVILQSSLTQVNCTSSAQNVTGVGVVTVYIDNEVTINNAVTFEYTNNPNYTSVSPDKTIPAGGIILTFNGTYLNVSQKALLVINGMAGTFPCIQTFTTLKCYAPPVGSSPIGSSLSPGVDYTIVMDGAPGPVGDPLKIAVVSNPIFTSINPNDLMQTVGSVKIIRINGMNIMNVDVLSEIMVTVGGERCTIDLGTTTAIVLSCQPPQNLSTVSSMPSKKRQSSSRGNVVVSVGRLLSYTPGSISLVTSNVVPFPISGVAGGVAGGGVGLILLLVLVVAIIVVVYRRDSVKKRQQVSALMVQMETLETNMAEECKRAFTELQTELQDVVNVRDKNYPYRDFRSFAMKFLFPTAEDDHPILKPVQFPSCVDQSEATKQLQLFEQLVLDKRVLLVMIHTLEEQQGRFTLQDRCNMASLLSVALQSNMTYATDILLELLKALMAASASKVNPKLLLRRTESVAEKLLANWLCFLLYPYVHEHAGEPLFILFRAIKSQLEKAPVDVITGEARNSLSEEKLLRQHLDVNVVEGVVENGNEVIPIKLLDTDTISQAKEKILDALYKNTPFSRRPQLGEVDLELRRGNAGIKLYDRDPSSESDGDWVRINTLGHYKLDQMSQLYVKNSKNPQPRFMLAAHSEVALGSASFDIIGASMASNSHDSMLLSAEGGTRFYHLTRPEVVNVMAAGEEGTQRQGNKIMSEVFLTRLLATKRILQPYVDELFQVLFTVPSGTAVPKPIKYLFDFLDVQAADMGISDPDVLHTWKTNSLLLRFWVSIIKNPEFAFDIHKTSTVDSCLSVISQAYIDACATSDIKYTKDTPSAKLLYVNEVNRYKDEVKRYYDAIQMLPRLDRQEVDSYFSQASRIAEIPAATYSNVKDNEPQYYFHSDSALYELLKCCAQYSLELCQALNSEGSFAMKLLFPTAEDDHPILKLVQFPPGSDLSEATKQLQLFKKLVLDKRVLLVMIRTLEERQGRFTLQDRCNMASLLSVVLQSNMTCPYYRHFKDTLTTCKADNFWRTLVHMILAIKSQLEKGPVDVITGEERNSLSEEKLLKYELLKCCAQYSLELCQALNSEGLDTWMCFSTVILIGQYGLDGTAGNVSRTSGNLFSVTASWFTRSWHGGFVAGSYTYFVVLDVSTSATRPGVRVLRVCDNSNETSVAVMYEAEINCFTPSAVDASSMLLGASLLESFPSGGASTLVIGLSTPNVSPLSRVCTVGLSSIDSSMNDASCSPTILPWRAATTSSLSCPNRCTISSPGAIGTYTSTLAFNYESLALLFIAYTDNTGAFIQEYNITTTPPAVSSFATWPMPGLVTRLTWTSGQNYVYAITSTSVVQVPIEQCSSFTDCLSCAANVNPLCGWCTVEQKCSRMSEQHSVSKMVFDCFPRNITLTISSGLPSPLTGESFLCLLSTGNGVPISVPCSQVNQTTFTSNITGAISQLNTPKLVVNIGFGSSLLNIPFATSRLTTYNCAAATSCISCLQTDGVCGWCNVEKRCTALNTSCSNSNSVTPAGGQTYLDVCPSLLNGSYLLPVAVNRPLVLNTKNLPPLVSGYMYRCFIASSSGPISLPANYTSSTSISCLYTAAQISLPVGTTAMLANISLIWTNSGTVVYPIDPLGVIQVTLYSCSAFSFTSCTFCLAVNIETCPSITNQLLNCPSPVLKSVSPSSGPFGGGTRLTITGTDLGVTVGDIANVTVGGVNCSVQPDGFKPVQPDHDQCSDSGLNKK